MSYIKLWKDYCYCHIYRNFYVFSSASFIKLFAYNTDYFDCFIHYIYAFIALLSCESNLDCFFSYYCISNDSFSGLEYDLSANILLISLSASLHTDSSL